MRLTIDKNEDALIVVGGDSEKATLEMLERGARRKTLSNLK